MSRRIALVLFMGGLTLLASHRLAIGEDAVRAFVRNPDAYSRVTEKPYQMDNNVATLCRPPSTPDSPHKDIGAYCHVFVNQLAHQPLVEGSDAYPVGSLIVKQKLEAIDSKTASLYTAMRKRPAGYDPANGDWEYIVTDGVGKVLAQGCIECHQAYRKTGFVTREYLSQK